MNQKQIQENLESTNNKVMIGSMTTNAILKQKFKTNKICKICSEELKGSLTDKLFHFNTHFSTGTLSGSYWLDVKELDKYLGN